MLITPINNAFPGSKYSSLGDYHTVPKRFWDFIRINMNIVMHRPQMLGGAHEK